MTQYPLSAPGFQKLRSFLVFWAKKAILTRRIACGGDLPQDGLRLQRWRQAGGCFRASLCGLPETCRKARPAFRRSPMPSYHPCQTRFLSRWVPAKFRNDRPLMRINAYAIIRIRHQDYSLAFFGNKPCSHLATMVNCPLRFPFTGLSVGAQIDADTARTMPLQNFGFNLPACRRHKRILRKKENGPEFRI